MLDKLLMSIRPDEIANLPLRLSVCLSVCPSTRRVRHKGTHNGRRNMCPGYRHSAFTVQDVSYANMIVWIKLCISIVRLIYRLLLPYADCWRSRANAMVITMNEQSRSDSHSRSILSIFSSVCHLSKV